MHPKVVELLKIVEDNGLKVGRAAALPRLMYDGNWHSVYKDDILLITRLSNRIDLSRSIPEKFQNCAGNFNNNGSIVVIIGEKPAGPSPFRRSYPFNDVDGCSGWLNRLLAKAKIDESKLFWVNAYNLDDSSNDSSMVNEVNPKEVICLGKTAEKWAKENGWECKTFYHPQYWKRFKSKEDYPLIEHLHQATST